MAIGHFAPVRRYQIVHAAKPRQHFTPFQSSGFSHQKGMVRRIRPIAKIGDKAMFLWILVNVSYQLNKISIGGDFNAAEGVLEETSSASVGFVNCLGVGVEKIAELLTGIFTDPKGFKNPSGLLLFFQRLNSHQEVKMIPQQTISECIGYRLNVVGVELQEVRIIALSKKMFSRLLPRL